jgi:hypothetical protein
MNDPKTATTALARLQARYKDMHTVGQRPWSTAEDHRDVRESLREAIREARATLATLDKHPMTAELQRMRSDLATWVELSAGTLREGTLKEQSH